MYKINNNIFNNITISMPNKNDEMCWVKLGTSSNISSDSHLGRLALPWQQGFRRIRSLAAQRRVTSMANQAP